MRTRARRYSSHIQIDDTLEELGKLMNASCDVLIDVCAEPEEPKTWEYPGSPARIEVELVTVTSYSNGDVELKRVDRPDWFEWLDRIAARYVTEDRVIDRLPDEEDE